MEPEKIICYTLDLEHDYAGPAPAERYETLANPNLKSKLEEIVTSNQLRLTVFATGRILEDHPEYVEFFQRLGAEIELHGYEHTWVKPDLIQELEKGVRAYQAYFGKPPLGYRSQGGILSPELLHALVDVGIQYDSSLIPSFRLGFYQNAQAETRPHFHDQLSLLEIPMGVIPRIRLPIFASYIRLFGFHTYQLLFSLFGKPSPLIFLFHLVDLVPVSMRKRLSPFLRTAYSVRESQGLPYFEKTVQYFRSAGYQSDFMSTICQANIRKAPALFPASTN